LWLSEILDHRTFIQGMLSAVDESSERQWNKNYIKQL
jgi:hypothetical protein